LLLAKLRIFNTAPRFRPTFLRGQDKGECFSAAIYPVPRRLFRAQKRQKGIFIISFPHRGSHNKRASAQRNS
jgi:hypothetical protein